MADSNRLAMLGAITILDASPAIVDVFEELVHQLWHAAPKDKVLELVQHLEGWWFSAVISALSTNPVGTIQVLTIDQRIDDLRELFKRDALVVDTNQLTPPHEVVAQLDSRPFVSQLRRIAVGERRIEYSIRDYYRASEQRSRWIRSEALRDGEIENFERLLVEAWEPRFAAMVEALPSDSSPTTKQIAGESIFRWAEQDAVFALRTINERFLTHGTYHILSNRYALGWHPDYLNPIDSAEDSGKS